MFSLVKADKRPLSEVRIAVLTSYSRALNNRKKSYQPWREVGGRRIKIGELERGCCGVAGGRVLPGDALRQRPHRYHLRHPPPSPFLPPLYYPIGAFLPGFNPCIPFQNPYPFPVRVSSVVISGCASLRAFPIKTQNSKLKLNRTQVLGNNMGNNHRFKLYESM
jgi:hypothetical protein